jgi:hypothetical protein
VSAEGKRIRGGRWEGERVRRLEDQKVRRQRAEGMEQRVDWCSGTHELMRFSAFQLSTMIYEL